MPQESASERAIDGQPDQGISTGQAGEAPDWRQGATTGAQDRGLVAGSPHRNVNYPRVYLCVYDVSRNSALADVTCTLRLFVSIIPSTPLLLPPSPRTFPHFSHLFPLEP